MTQNSTEGFRLSPQQTNLWSLQQQTSAAPYRAVCAIELLGQLREDALKAAANEIVRRHEILRTTFQRPPGIKMPFQVVAENVDPAWQTLDLSSLDRHEQHTKVDSYFAVEHQQPFNFEQAPLLNLTLFRLSAEHHVLIVSLPSLCADSKSLTNIARELSLAYDHIRGNAALTGEPMQYADFAEWQNELCESDDEPAREGKEFWRETLQPAQGGVLNAALPLERLRAQTAATEAFAAVALELDSALLEKIEHLAQSHDAAASSALFAFWQALVWRLSGASNFVLFNLCDGRKFEDLNEALGLYARYVPVHCSGADVAFAETLRSAHAALNAANEWQEYSNSATISLSSPDSIAFEFEERPAEFAASDLRFSIRKQKAFLQPFKLKLSCVRCDGKLSVELEYDPRRFERETIERIVGYFQKEIQTLAGGSSDATSIGAIDILGDAERQRLLIEFNRTAFEYAENKCVHELFEEQAAKAPAATALVFGDRELTYGHLNARANQLAHLLRRRGIAPNDRVGLCTERGVEMIVGLLGILKAGGAYVPLNPEHPKERLALQLEESKASLLITDAGSIDHSLEFTGETVDFKLHEGLLAAEPQTNPSSTVAPKNLVYVIYTSGSTGIPKGVAVTHGNLANYTQFILRRLQVDRPLQFASVSTISADLGNTCIFPSLVSGGCLHILSYDVAMAGELFRDYVASRPIDVLKIVPSHLNALLSADTGAEFLPVKYLIFGGEALSWEMVQRIARMKHTCLVLNHYGPTETTVGSLTYSVEADEVSPYSLTVPIGRPIANTRVFVLDKYLQPVPTGVAGELYIGGAGVAAGYLNQPAETAARFVADPFAQETGARLYRTGDLARYLPDGNIEFLGRVDHQVKVRGFRVELGEIEAVLAAHASVRQAVVTTGTVSVSPAASLSKEQSATSATSQRLIAYIVSAEAKPPTTDELRNLLKQKLPDYMVPSAFVFLKSLPLTPNGKIDRAALPAPDETRPDLQKIFVAPRTPVEAELAQIWAGLLKVNEVGVDDNFFDLGGHSLLATQVVSRMRQAFQVEISLRSLFESPTVAALAEKISNATTDETARLLAELEQLSDEEAELLLKMEQPPLDTKG